MKYLWTEDTGAGLHFWKLVNQLFFDDALVVESKESNQGLLDALADIDMKEDDKYYIAFDYVVDNQDMISKRLSFASRPSSTIPPSLCFSVVQMPEVPHHGIP